VSELSPARRVQLHADLLALESQLQAQLDADAARTDVVDLDLPIGRLTRMDAMQQQEMARAELRRKATRLVAVRAALERYADEPEDFGLCARCGELIAWGRLKLRPESPWCVPCLELSGRASSSGRS